MPQETELANFMKRNGRYTARVRRGGHPTQTKTFQRLSDARRWATDTERAIDVGTFIYQDSTLDQLLIRYAAEVTSQKRGAKVENYRLVSLNVIQSVNFGFQS